jgi:hypothetical protein
MSDEKHNPWFDTTQIQSSSKLAKAVIKSLK